jgi:4-aminobutyrate aminotransferase-like enzyme
MDPLAAIAKLECMTTSVPVMRELPAIIEKAIGSTLFTSDGRQLTDLTGGLGTAFVGYGNEAVMDAFTAQAGQLLHAGWLTATTARARLLERLDACIGIPDTRFMFAVSGSEGVEAALKSVRLATGRYGVLAFSGGFHGKTAACLEVTASPSLREGVAASRAVSVRLPYPADPALGQDPSLEGCLSWLETLLSGADFPLSEIAAILVEPVQGSRMNAPPAGFMGALRTLADRYGLLLIADEIYSGMARTGPMFAYQHDNVLPDILILGKALGAGLPLSVVAGPAAILDCVPPYKQTSTYQASPLACAVGAAVLEHLADIDSAAAVQVLRRAVQDAVDEVAGELLEHCGSRLIMTGLGLMIGLRLVGPDNQRARVMATYLRQELLRDGFLVAISDATLKLSPNLAITTRDLARFADSLKAAVALLVVRPTEGVGRS